MFLGKDEEMTVESLFFQGSKREDFSKRYSVNLFIDNRNRTGAPVIREMNPTYYNLFGKIEYVNEMGGCQN